jgi:transketolase
VTIRPADANEVREAWKVAVENRRRPTALVLTRQNLPTLDRTVFAPEEGLKKGAYVLADLGEGAPQIILMASGSEVKLIIEAGKRLADRGISVRLVSFPSWELFEEQDQAYQDSVLLPGVEARLAIEAGVSLGWDRWTGPKGRIIALSRFGASAPANTVFEKLGFSVENVEQVAQEMLGK